MMGTVGAIRKTGLLLVVLVCVGVDQITKVIAKETLRGEPPITLLGGVLRLIYAENPGVAISLGADLPPVLRFWLLTVGVAVVLSAVVATVPMLLDVRGRAVLQGARSGAVLAHDTGSLEPLWAWAALGSPTTGLAESPLGDRIYQAIGGEGAPARIIVRDLQTGRELASTTAAAPLEQLVAGEEGELYGIAREGRRVVVVALDSREGELAVRWRRTLSSAEEVSEVRLVPAERGVVVQGLGPRIGLRWLSAQDGRVLGRTRTDPLDVWYRDGEGLWALFPGELRRLE